MSYIPPELFSFFSDLRKNNDREWFAENKWRYEEHVKEPLLAFIAAFAEPLHRISPHFEAIPKVSGGSLFRIYRDTRFSKDKRPYKEAAGVQFRHAGGSSAHAPGFYLHLEPGDVFAALGVWGPDGRALLAIRTAIVENGAEWVAAKAAVAGTFDHDRHSDPLKRAPKGFDPEHEHVDDLKRRHFLATTILTQADACASDFLERLAGTYQEGAPYLRFLTEALGLPW